MKALIVEDTAEIAQQVGEVLASAGWQSAVAETGSDARPLARDPSLSLIVMDRMLPDADGLDIVAELRALGVETPVIMLTALGQTDARIEGYQRGADDYLAKPFEPDELLARIGALMRRSEGRVRTDLRVCGDIELHIKARRAHRGGRHLALSPKEFDLLDYLLDHAGAVVTRDMLLRHVWKLNFDPGTNVVDVNIGRLRRKLDPDGVSPVLHTVRGVGFRLGDATQPGAPDTP